MATATTWDSRSKYLVGAWRHGLETFELPVTVAEIQAELKELVAQN